jgi:outer membrane protein OmpA-like peptidoglycan-associated protein
MQRKKDLPLTKDQEDLMKTIRYRSWIPILFTAFVLVTTSITFAQNQTQANTVQVPAGQNMSIEGVVVAQQSDSMIVRGTGGAVYTVTFANGPAIKEKKSNPFRGAKKYTQADLVPGLQVEVKGSGTNSGEIAAREIRLRNDDYKVAQTMDTRVVPVENTLKETRTRLGETEQNAQRMSGQIQELSAVSNAARGGAKAAQETADGAMTAANDARSRADNAKAGVQAANERITSLDDFSIKHTATVHFKVGSAALSEESKSELEQLAAQAQIEKGYVIEVAGFASADGNDVYNRRLSQKRADAVIQYMAENYSIPLRRFITPMGYGKSQPVSDNKTLAGRKENRRVEVRILVSKGFKPVENTSEMQTLNQ